MELAVGRAIGRAFGGKDAPAPEPLLTFEEQFSPDGAPQDDIPKEVRSAFSDFFRPAFISEAVEG